MSIWSDVITPATLTGYVRESLADYQLTQGMLSQWLPDRLVPDIVARFVAGQAGLMPAAQYRSYDAETPIGSTPGGQRVTVELPPLGLKIRVSEYDQLRMRSAPSGDLSDQIVPAILRTANQTARAVADRIEIERGKALETAALSINENGFVQTGSWSRDAGMVVTATVLWSVPATAAPLSDFQLWSDAYLALNGTRPGSAVISSKVFAALCRTAEFRNLAGNLSGAPTVVSRDTAQQVLQAYGLPPLYVYDRQAKNAANSTAKILSDNKVFLLPEPTTGESELGGTFWGTTLESQEAEYGIAPIDQPGIVAGVWKTRDPIAAWVHSAAIGLPVLANSNLAMVASVLA
jgi:hypothetical protein